MQVKPPWTFIAMLAVGLLLALAFAAPYATQNQATYLLDPMARAMPDLFRRDWFVSGTPPYLPVFGWLAQWLYVIDPAGPVAVIAAHVVITAATYVAIYWLTSALRAGLAGFVIVASVVAVTTGLTMGGHYLLADYLQPSSLAMLGWIIALGAFARDRFALAGIAAALGGALHANFLVLGLGTFALAAFARRDVGVRSFAKLLLPQLAVLACFVPSLLAAAGPSEGAIWILTHFHAPGHYAGARLIGWVPDTIAWQLAAAAAYQLQPGKPARALWWFSLVTAAIAISTALVIRFTPFESLTQLRWGRIAPLGQLAAFALIVAAFVRCARGEGTRRQRMLLALALLGPFASLVLRSLIGWPAMFAGVAVVVALLLVPRASRTMMTALAIAAFAYALWKSPRGAGLTTKPIAWSDELRVTQWAAAHTPVDALFLAPPAMARFRVLARRAVIADIKSPPLRPDLLVQWYHRLTAMVLLPGAATGDAVEARYKRLTPYELLAVARAFDADYVVVTAKNPAWSQPPVFDTPSLKVYAVPR